MANTVSQYQQTPFTNLIDGQVADAVAVQGNDNATVGKYNTHDADPTIHVQQSVLASRPPVGTVKGLWYATDTNVIYYDTGSAWVAVGTVFTGGTVANPTTFTQLVSVTNGDGSGNYLQLNGGRNGGHSTIEFQGGNSSLDVTAYGDGIGSFVVTSGGSSLLVINPSTGTRIVSGGFTVTAGGITVTAGGATINGVLTNNGGGFPLVLNGGGGLTSDGNIELSTLKGVFVNTQQIISNRIAGWGTPTGPSRISNFPGASATLVQTSEALAQLITDLETHGLLGT